MKKGSFIPSNRLPIRHRTESVINAANPCSLKREDTVHFMPAPVIRIVKPPCQQIQPTAGKKPASIVLNKAVPENWFNDRPNGGKSFTGAAVFRIAPLQPGTSLWQKNAPSAAPSFWWKKPRKNRERFWPVIPRVADSRQRPNKFFERFRCQALPQGFFFVGFQGHDGL